MSALDEELEFFFDKPWSDGLPVVIPTEERIERMLTGTRRDPEEAVGNVPPLDETATVRTVAAHAVMAGCRPEYMPVVLAGLEAIIEDQFCMGGIQGTMHSVAPLLIVNGPYAKQIGIQGGSGCFGPGFRANATIGRAIRLMLHNLGGGIPNICSMSTFSQPCRFTFCIRENEEDSPWEPLSVSRGFRAEENVVTAVACENPKLVFDDTSREPESLLTGIADAMAHLGGMNALRRSDMVVAIRPEHTDILSRAGPAKAEVHERLCKMAGRTLGELKRGGGYHEDRIKSLPVDVDLGDDGAFVPTMKDPSDLIIVVAGGVPGPISAIMSGWTGASRPVTKAVEA